jgi:pyruvate kinase
MKRHEGDHPRQTRIVATIGLCPEPSYPQFLQKITEAGADVLRINMSHCDVDYAKERAILAWANAPVESLSPPHVAVMADLQGPKSRIGKLPDDGVELLAGHTVLLVPDGAVPHVDANPDGSQPPRIPLPQPLGAGVMTSLGRLMARKPGLRPSVLFGDGDIVLEVVSLAADHVRCVVVAPGLLGSRKGITIREVDLDLDPFPDKDQRDLLFCLEHHIDFVALSFVRTRADIDRVRDFIASHGPASTRDVRLIAKIETLAALENIEGILAASDGIMVARGDLGLQLGVEEVPMVQKQLVVAARRHGKPVIVATQMLESMITNPTPTRAESTDVFNAIVDGGDAVMLSGETSVGLRPYQVVATMDRITRKAEAWMHDIHKRTPKSPLATFDGESATHLHRITEAFSATAVQFAEHLPAKAIVCFTRTGRTPERLSRHRPSVPLLAFCSTTRSARSLLLYYGVHPVVMSGFDADREKLQRMVAAARVILHAQYGMTRGDAIVVTAGIDWPRGGTNALQVLIEDHTLAADTALNSANVPWSTAVGFPGMP